MGHKSYGSLPGPVVIVGFGSIGKGTLPLLLRHFEVDKSRIVIIDPSEHNAAIAKKEGVRLVHEAITERNYRRILEPLLKAGPGRGWLLNLAVGVSSYDLIKLCSELDAFYIDTVVEPWEGFYTNEKLSVSERSNYALRESVLSLRGKLPRKTTAISCCGANPGMVSWFVKRALLNIAHDLDIDPGTPNSREEWAALMRLVGVKGIHIAERDTQRPKAPKPIGTFVNTWSVEGFVCEGLQPAELGWGTHEKKMPALGYNHETGCRAAIYIKRPGVGTRVRSWTPTAQSQHAFLVTHNEAISIADYFTVREKGKVVYRPTCHYAYRPCDDAVLSIDEMAGRGWQVPDKMIVYDEDDIVEGKDELGVLLYGHAKNAYWYGSQLSIEETRKLAPYQNATGLQVSSAVLAGMVWAQENPECGIVEADDMDYSRCLDIQMPYLGPVVGVYTDWTPLHNRGVLFPEDLDEDDPWQFSNIIV